MTIAVDIHPASNTLCMINEPDSSTTYSLSGHVSVSLSSRDSLFERVRTEKVLLRSLIIIFEGQTELITNETGYSAARLCRVTRELAPAQAMLLSNDNHEGSDSSSVWNFVFDLPIPGWLPSSSIFGTDIHGPTGTSYSLFAEARFTPLEGPHSRSWSFSTLCMPFWSRPRIAKSPRVDIEVVRCTLPTILEELDSSVSFPDAMFVVHARCADKDDAECPEDDIFSNIELRASIPEYVDMDSGSFMLTLRLRAGALSAEQQRKLRLSHFRMQLSQSEVYSRRPSRSYTSAFPLPSSQPDSTPLLNAHPVKAMYDIGLAPVNFPEGEVPRVRTSFSLLPHKQQGRYALPYGGVSLLQEAAAADENVWTRLDMIVPFEGVSIGEDEIWERQNGRVKALRADEDSPFFRVHHELEVELTFTYEGGENGDDASIRESMVFSIPVKFARLPPTNPWDDSTFLPAYSQLFYSNGERRTDYSTPLPMYTAKADPESIVAEEKTT
ncbi:uncharacterized protein FOMMEDRAFT_166053 [Fomitiporia mediterranea MF3/22]|uniref:uncharacterized protein n=1 Tax=Fomitiporia mediterranea (strain MF3/22) TaxID=694068 RepID=UPI00044081C5|nr:uncharacterized protein FOMMEDRAFT_166053 [Fomitiporia mediterranea MF3/22]EJD05698.1 hypothetical protein FOMMEDRAFT_166053 [Fomitiporia mediterranea MF3/22]